MSAKSAPRIFTSPVPDIEPLTVAILPEYIFDNDIDLDRPALIDSITGEVTTHAQVRERVYKAATGLTSKGFEKGEVAAIFSPNSCEYVVAFHAIALSRGIVSTVNPLYNATEFAHQLKICKAVYIFTVASLVKTSLEAAKLSGAPVREIFIVGSNETVAESQVDGVTISLYNTLLDNDGKYPFRPADKEDILAIPFSSGTTGLAKGVALSHFNLAVNCAQLAVIEDYGPNDVMIATLPFFHSYGMLVYINNGLKKGLCSVVMPAFNFVTYFTLVQKYKATHLHMVPPIALAMEKNSAVLAKFDLSSVKQFISAAAPMAGSLESRIIKAFPWVKDIKQAYGMTELSPLACISPVGKTRIGSVGALVSNMKVKVVNVQTGELLGPNQEGEIWFSGPNVMLGYYEQPEETKKMIDEDGFLHSGDIGILDEDGYVFITDRLKELIKYKGFQVAPAELEAILLSHESIADAAVVPVKDDEAGELPKAFVVVKENHTVTAEEIVEFVGKQVAPHKKLRGGVEFIAQIPKASSGKILRRSLRKD
eukprot:TRINITY_DN9469_c0_g1_i1.p1 TRINITY_DN9469_c0_g1~~TRINITY_DN9469_c0_g1_i1.p1  ORF type:complete len:538 (+),score=220.97 TRINITY_DN9469_c0_g1_i1:46-1659(+)